MMDDEIWNMYSHFPQIVPLNGFTKWEGYVTTDYLNPCQVVVKTPMFPSLEGLEIFCSQEKAAEKTLKNEKFESLTSLLLHLKSCLEVTPAKDIKVLAAVAEASEYGKVSDDMTSVSLAYTDSFENDHELEISLPVSNSPVTILHAELPEEMIARISQKTSVVEVYECFKEIVESLVPFWAMCHRLSCHAWVVEPLQPTKKDIHRRLYISDNLSIHLVFNPLRFNEMPEIKFLGSINAANQARTVYQDSLQKIGWDRDQEVVENLRVLLNLECLPRAPTSASEQNDAAVDCVICYEGATPGGSPLMKWCPNSACSSITHHSCLIEWLNTVPTSKVCFDHISGPCPHCDEKLFCPLTA